MTQTYHHSQLMPISVRAVALILTVMIGSVGVAQEQSSPPITGQKSSEVVSADDADSRGDQPVGGDSISSLQLIREMLEGDFAQRQAATTGLLQMGRPALPALRQEALRSNGAQRERIELLIQRVQSGEFGEQLKRLQSQPSPELARKFYGWERFSRMADGSEGTMFLFTEIQAAEQELFQTALFDVGGLPGILEQRSARLAREFHGRTDVDFPAAAFAGLLLVGSDPDVRLLRATSTHISDGLADERFSRLLTEGKHRDVLRALVNSWIQRPGISAERPLLFSLQHRLEGGRSVAKRLIDARSNRFDMILAIVTLAALGDQSDIPELEQLFEVNNVLWPPRGQVAQRANADANGEATSYNVQTRDIALVAALHLRGVDFSQFQLGVRPHELTVFAVDSLGFETEESREAAFDNYAREFPRTSTGPAQH